MVREVTLYESKQGAWFETAEEAEEDDLIQALYYSFLRRFGILRSKHTFEEEIDFCAAMVRSNPERAKHLLAFLKTLK